MLFFNTRLLATVIAMSLTGAAANAAGECAKITNPKKRDVCIEKKIDELNANFGSKVGAEIAKVVPGQVSKALTGVKIEWRDHPGVCLYFKDWTSDQNYTYSVLGCDHGEQIFNIHQ